MPDFTVTIEGEYVIEADSPKQAIEEAFERTSHPDRLTVVAVYSNA